jgi:hypothetical protein
MDFNFTPVYLALLVLMSCGDPGEQQANRQKLMEGLDDHKIKRITEDQILSAAYQEGEKLVIQLDSLSGNDPLQPSFNRSQLDSLNNAVHHQSIKLITFETPVSELTEHESALFEAYQYSAGQGQYLNQNVQVIDDQSLLYTHPLVRDNELLGMWSLLLDRKTLIRDL